MRINKGLTLLFIAIAGIIFFNIMNWSSIIFYFIGGMGLAMLNKYWGEEKK
jgi:hypothetical protein